MRTSVDRAFLDALLEVLAQDHALHVDAGRYDLVGIEFAGFHQVLHLGDGDLAGAGHHGIKVARGLAINQVAHAVAFPGFHQREVGGERAFQQVHAAVELAHFFALRHHGAHAGGRDRTPECPLRRRGFVQPASLAGPVSRPACPRASALPDAGFHPHSCPHGRRSCRLPTSSPCRSRRCRHCWQWCATRSLSCDSAAIRLSGTPHIPKPPIMMLAPSAMSATAASELATTLFTGH